MPRFNRGGRYQPEKISNQQLNAEIAEMESAAAAGERGKETYYVAVTFENGVTKEYEVQASSHDEAVDEAHAEAWAEYPAFGITGIEAR